MKPDQSRSQSHYLSWGRYPQTRQQLHKLHWQDDLLPTPNNDMTLLAYGQGRSYGDVCLNHNGILLDTNSLDRFICFDNETGILRCEAGVTLAEILELVLPQGWFLPVTPGTKYVTVGGAVANDVHGKNHHRAGSFGCHVHQLALRRSNKALLICSPDQNPELFNATIGGLGLTGLICWVEFKLKKVSGSNIEQEMLRFNNLHAFFSLSQESDKDWEYTVAWVDCLAKGASLGRGIFMRGNHTADNKNQRDNTVHQPRFNLPMDAPRFTLNHFSVQTFNQLYFHRPLKRHAIVHFDPFFYPLDKIGHWNRLYGKRGFLQYQCLIPEQHAEVAMEPILSTIAESGQGSFLSVLKQFGDIQSPGMLSFPRKGVTLALDFPIAGTATFEFLDRLDIITREYNGAVYPAKDARMSAESFQHYFPNWKSFSDYIDPAFSSSFWRRVTQQAEKYD